jgi:hypothetical protein
LFASCRGFTSASFLHDAKNIAARKIKRKRKILFFIVFAPRVNWFEALGTDR